MSYRLNMGTHDQEETKSMLDATTKMNASASAMKCVDNVIEFIEEERTDKRGWYKLKNVDYILAISNASDSIEVLSVGFIMTSFYDAENMADGGSRALSAVEKEALSASVFTGMLIGGLACGALSDQIGRKPCLTGSLFICSLAGMLSAFAPNVWFLAVMRVFVGLGVGGTVPSVFTLAAELAAAKSRGAILSLIASFWMVGSIYAALTAWVTLGEDLNGERILKTTTWRSYALISAIPSFVSCFLTYVYMPESPRYLVKKGEFGRAALELHKLLHTEGLVSSEERKMMTQHELPSTSKGNRNLSSTSCETELRILPERIISTADDNMGQGSNAAESAHVLDGEQDRRTVKGSGHNEFFQTVNMETQDLAGLQMPSLNSRNALLYLPSLRFTLFSCV